MTISKFIKWLVFAAVAVVLVFFSSCVSKKKFMALKNERETIEKRFDALRSDQNALYSDFDQYRNTSEKEMALKQNTIDSLRMAIISDNIGPSKNEEIESELFGLQIENAKLKQQLLEKEKEVRNLTREINTLSMQVGDLTKEYESARSGFKFPFGNVKQLERKIELKDKEITYLDSCLYVVNDTLTILRSEVDSLLMVIERLQAGEMILDQPVPSEK